MNLKLLAFLALLEVTSAGRDRGDKGKGKDDNSKDSDLENVQLTLNVEPELLDMLKSGKETNCFIKPKNNTANFKSIIHDFRANRHFNGKFRSINDRHKINTDFVDRLRENWKRGHQHIKWQRFQSKHDVKQFWITGESCIKKCNMDTLKALEEDADQIDMVYGDRVHTVLEAFHEDFGSVEESGSAVEEEGIGVNSDGTPKTGTNPVQWGVDAVGAPEAWSKGFTGEGVILGVMDTGVRGSHACLKGNFLGDYGWYDAVDGQTIPYDDHGHGTHCCGSACGKCNVGVAPNAKWCACKAISKTGTGTQSAFMECGQWMLSPWKPGNKSDTDPSQSPSVISCSWGSPTTSDWYYAIIEAWLCAGKIVFYSNGNTGSGCQTTGSPTSHPGVISCGSHDVTGTISSFSSRGPTLNGTVKPDLAAPGQNITSASYMSDKGLLIMSGTSMATPHAAGVACLMMGSDKYWDRDCKGIKEALAQGCTKPKVIGQTCGGTMDIQTFPDKNNIYGFGKISAANMFK